MCGLSASSSSSKSSVSMAGQRSSTSRVSRPSTSASESDTSAGTRRSDRRRPYRATARKPGGCRLSATVADSSSPEAWRGSGQPPGLHNRRAGQLPAWMVQLHGAPTDRSQRAGVGRRSPTSVCRARSNRSRARVPPGRGRCGDHRASVSCPPPPMSAAARLGLTPSARRLCLLEHQGDRLPGPARAAATRSASRCTSAWSSGSPRSPRTAGSRSPTILRAESAS